MSSPSVTLSNQIVSAIQNALAPLPALSVDDYFFDPLGTLDPHLRANVMEIASREIQTAASLAKADLAVLQARQEDWRGKNKALVPAWACLFRLSSDPSEFARLVAGPGPENALSLSSFNLGKSPRPGVIAVHQPMSFGHDPSIRLFLRLAGFLEIDVLASDYFETRLMQDEDEEPHQVLEVLAGASMLFGVQHDRMVDALAESSDVEPEK